MAPACQQKANTTMKHAAYVCGLVLVQLTISATALPGAAPYRGKSCAQCVGCALANREQKLLAVACAI